MLLRFSQAHDDLPLPAYAHDDDAGFDICAAVPREGVYVTAHNWMDIPTGLRFEVPKGFELQIRPRSGLSAHIRILNAPGTIDSGYRGELKIRVSAQPWETYHVKRGERIAQAVLTPVYQAVFVRVDDVSSDTPRGEGGFGSTGT